MLFVDKLKFRELTKSIFPNFYFKEVRVEDLKKIRFNELSLPFIIKPTVGFFSMGVYKVSSYEKLLSNFEKPIELRKIDLKKVLCLWFLIHGN